MTETKVKVKEKIDDETQLMDLLSKYDLVALQKEDYENLMEEEAEVQEEVDEEIQRQLQQPITQNWRCWNCNAINHIPAQ